MNLPPGPFGCILADPPWAFRLWWGGRSSKTPAGVPSRATVPHYDVLSEEDLAAIPVGSVAAKDCALFMWIVDAMLPQSLQLAEAWGFQFKCVVFVWSKDRYGIKPHPGLGYWSRKQAELCLLFTRGRPKRLGAGVEQIIHCPRGAHSAKPDEQYNRIERLVGGPYLELFARTRRPGWEAWGDQVGIRDGLFDELGG